MTGIFRRSTVQLRQAQALLNRSIDEIAAGWEHNYYPEDKPSPHLGASDGSFDPVKTALSALGLLESLITDPHRLLINLSTSYVISRVLHIVADHDIAEILKRRKDKNGVYIEDLATATGLETEKLCRIMRALASHHIFQEVEEGYFSNNHISEVLAGDPAFRAHIMMKGRVHYTASDHLSNVLRKRDTEPRCDVYKTAFQRAVGTELSIFDWMNQYVPEHDTNWRLQSDRKSAATHRAETISDVGADAVQHHDGTVHMVPRPEQRIFYQAMAGLDRGSSPFYLQDYPWHTIGDGTVVDVGGGIGSFCMQLYALHPSIRLVVQDRAPVLKQAKATWEATYPSSLLDGRVELAIHDFFTPNPVVGAGVYWLRYILHDWPDVAAGEILKNVASSMTANSMVLIADQVVNTTLGCLEIASAPSPLLANYGRASAYAHMMDLNMMMMVNGRERTPEELKSLIQSSGLEIVKIWLGQGIDTLGLVECRLASSVNC